MRSTGRSNGCRNVRSPLKTWVINRPDGFVTASTTARKSRICNQPLTVISELLRAQQRVGEVDEQQCRGRQAQDRFPTHDTRLTASARTRGRTRARAGRKESSSRRSSYRAPEPPAQLKL